MQRGPRKLADRSRLSSVASDAILPPSMIAVRPEARREAGGSAADTRRSDGRAAEVRNPDRDHAELRAAPEHSSHEHSGHERSSKDREGEQIPGSRESGLGSAQGAHDFDRRDRPAAAKMRLVATSVGAFDPSAGRRGTSAGLPGDPPGGGFAPLPPAETQADVPPPSPPSAFLSAEVDSEDIAAQLSMVRFLARRIHERLPSHVELEELVGAGVLGLMDAYKKFNPGKNVKFRSYAQFRVRGAILDSLRTLDWSPRELRRKAREIEAAIQRLTGKIGRSPTELEVASELKMALADYQHVLGDLKSLELGTLNSERSEDSGEEELAYIPSRSEDDPLFQCLRSEMHGRLKQAIERLPERERMVMNLYYFEELTMKEIGQIMGVVESRISQVHASGVLHLRAALSAFHKEPRTRSGAASGSRPMRPQR